MDAFEKTAIPVATFEDGQRNGGNPEGNQDGQLGDKVATFEKLARTARPLANPVLTTVGSLRATRTRFHEQCRPRDMLRPVALATTCDGSRTRP